MATTSFSQFRAGGEHKGRTATLKAVAYCTGESATDERNNRRFDYDGQGRGERILKAGMFLPSDFPAQLDRGNFQTLGAFQQAVWTSLAKFEEKQRKQHAGRTGRGKPIISRHDVLLLDKRIFLDGNGKPRPDGIAHAEQVVRDFLRENYTRKGLVASFAIHDQDGIGGTGNGNFHVHIVSSYRTLSAEGWGERKRPFGKSAWAAWAKQKQSSLFKIQTRKLEQLGAIPKAERTTSKRATLTAWKMQRGFMTQRIFRLERKFTGGKSFASFAPVPHRKAIISAGLRMPAITVGASFGKCAALSYRRAELPDNFTERFAGTVNDGNATRGAEPQHHSDGGSGGGGGDGVDFVLTELQGMVADAEAKLRTAMQTGIGIPAAEAALAAAKLNLAAHGRRGKGKAQRGRAVRPKFKPSSCRSFQK